MPVPKGMSPKSFFAKEEMHKKGMKPHSESPAAEKKEHPRAKAIAKKMGK